MMSDGANTATGQAAPTAATDLPDTLVALLPRLRSFALRICGDLHDAEDLVQRACVRALERMHQLRPGTCTHSWLFAILQSIWINELRARKVRSRSGAEWSPYLQETTADPRGNAPETEVLYRQLLHAVQALPEGQRLAIMLVDVEGLSYKEAAGVLGVAVGTVMSRLARARRRLAALLEPLSAPRIAGAALGQEA